MSCPWIFLTRKALKKAKNLQKSNFSWRKLSLRLYLSGKDCDGFLYGIAFDKKNKDDKAFPHGSLSLVVDPQTFTYVEGSTVDWDEKEGQSGFVVHNPNHKNFRGKFFLKDQKASDVC